MPALRFETFAALLLAVLFDQTAVAQSSAPVSSTRAVHEFPVTMVQSVAVGKTPVGTKVEAKLTTATLVDRTVIPIGATFLGEVVESEAKSATNPSRLAIRMDTAQWKNGSLPVKVYLTAWYYPVLMEIGSGSSNASAAPPHDILRGRSPASLTQPFPGSPPHTDASSHSPSNVSDKRVIMKGVESMRNGSGALVLASARSNLKLDKTTTYVLAEEDLMPEK